MRSRFNLQVRSFAACACESEHGYTSPFEKGDDGSVEFEGGLPLCCGAGTARSQPALARRRRVSSRAPRRARGPLGCAARRETELGRLQRALPLSPLAVVDFGRPLRPRECPCLVPSPQTKTRAGAPMAARAVPRRVGKVGVSYRARRRAYRNAALSSLESERALSPTPSLRSFVRF